MMFLFFVVVTILTLLFIAKDNTKAKQKSLPDEEY